MKFVAKIILIFVAQALIIFLNPNLVKDAYAQCQGVWYGYRRVCKTRDREPPYACVEFECSYVDPVWGPYSCVASYPGGQLSCNPGINDCGIYQNLCETPGGGSCGDSVCDPGETSANCPSDCGGGGGAICGNGSCEAGEDATNCPSDCGGGGGNAVCGAPCTDASQCNFTNPNNPACTSGICWDSTCGGGDPPGGSCQNGETCPNGLFCSPGQACRLFNSVWQCNPNPDCALCSIDLVPVTTRLPIGSTTDLSVNINYQGPGSFTIRETNFNSSNTVTATVVSPDSFSPFSTTVSGIAPGTVTVTANAQIGNNQCSDSATVTVTPPAAWWQARNGDVVAKGSLTSFIPTSTCILPGCDPFLVRKGGGGYPGVGIYAGNFDFLAGSGRGAARVSETGWLAKSQTNGKSYSFSYFKSLISGSVTLNNTISTDIQKAKLESQGTASNGYVWWESIDQDGIINQEITLSGGRKVILLINGGDLRINGNINLSNTGSDFFLALVGKKADGSKGNIYIGKDVTNLDGVYFADATFDTDANGATTQLTVRGAVAALGFNLGRDLGNSNQTTPSEYFNFVPEIVFANFPNELSNDRIQWREVSP